MKGRAKPQTSWSEKDVEILTQGKREGKSASEIAADLAAAGSTFSRNAVIGKLTRIFKSLPGDHELVRASRAALAAKRQAKEAAKTAQKPAPTKRRVPLSVVFPLADPEIAQAGARRPGLYLDDEWPRNACRYPLFKGSVDLTGPIFCGEPVAKRSFCAKHYALCWVKPPRPVRLASDQEPPPSKAREFIFGRRYA